MSELLDAALAYARIGWHVFPVEPRGKRPIGMLVPRGKDDATTDEARIRAWWASCPDANIGVACEPSGLVVLDVDIADGKRGRESLAEIDSQLTPTLTAQTGSGGIHAIYRRPADVQAQQSIGFRPGLDLIGKGYIVAAPSLHANGTCYAWREERVLADLPPVLQHVQRTPRDTAVAAVGERIPEGERNRTLTSLGGTMRRRGFGEEAITAALIVENGRCVNTRGEPDPLPENEIRGIAHSVMRYAPEADPAAGAQVREIVGGAAPVQTTARMLLRDIAATPRPPMRMYPLGIPQLDAMLGDGAATSEVIGLVAPPSVGKTGFWIDRAIELQKQRWVLHVSTELPQHNVMARYAANLLNVPWRDCLKGVIARERQFEAVRDLSVECIGSDNLDRDDPIGQIAREALAMREAYGETPVIVIDYVQQLARSGDEGIRGRVGELTLKIREMAQALDTVVLAVFTTQRSFYSGERLTKLLQQNDASAFLSAAKESGDIEYDCAVILFLVPDPETQGEGINRHKLVAIAVARSRNGEVGFAGARFYGASGRWESAPLAAVEMTSEARQAKRHEAKHAAAEERIIEFVRKLQAKPHEPGQKSALLSKSALAQTCGGNKADALATIDHCLCDRRLEDTTEEFYDQHTRPKKRPVIRVPEVTP